MKFNDVEKVSDNQIAFCRKLNIDVTGDSVGVAYAKIEEKIQEQFWGHKNSDVPTEKQIDLATKFEIDISKVSRLVGNAVIGDIMWQLNANAIREQNLKPGLPVRKVYEEFGTTYVISSISKNGTVYFKGGNGQKAWARSLVSMKNSSKTN